jgi:hypothetical protein
MEFLTTYGWAIIILTIVLGVLFMGGFFNTGDFFAQQTCTIPGGFDCQVLTMNSIGGMNVIIVQGTADAINLTAYSCNQNASLTKAYFQYPASPVYLPVGSNYTISLKCFTNKGVAFNGVVGTPFVGYLIIRYNDSVTNLQTTLTGKVETKVNEK